ncbi:MAG TPA: Fe2+-dependent dioxygenase [Caulobacteraceae bacterium]|nr:Fe2+-dependent dioxygenase [Caulobacteraceae bacterium]
MLLCIPQVLKPEEVAHVRERLAGAEWVDGAATAGEQSRLVKKNSQVREGSAVAVELGELILDALGRSPLFVSAALPLKTFPPLFNRYEAGEQFGSHIDNAIRPVRGTAVRVRTDLSCTLFLTDPDDYDGGELVIEGAFGTQEVKLEAGDMVLYPGSSLHHVTPVTRGARVSAFFWVQSMVRDETERTLLFDLDQTVQSHAAEHGQGHATTVRLTGVYHNLIRRFADT